MKVQRNNPFIRILIIGIVVVAGMILFNACHGGVSRNETSQGDTLALNYAEYLTIVEYDGCTEMHILNPWDRSKLLQTIVISEKHDFAKGNVVQLNSSSLSENKAIFFTATHSNLVEELGRIDAIAGICETEYIANPRLRKGIAEGRIKDLGSAMIPNRERIVSLAPDMIFLSPYENTSTYGSLEMLGIPIIQCADYMETSALGRAEWIRFYGRLLGKGREADSLFMEIEAEYNALLSLTDSIEETNLPSVLFDTRNGSAWYVPGGRSTMAQLVRDAGGRYIFDDNPKSGSVPLSFEKVISRGRGTDVWLVRYNNHIRMTLADFGRIYHPYTSFKAYKNGNVYGCNSAELVFYEETPFHPERLLRDYIRILHPELLSSDTLRYFHKL